MPRAIFGVELPETWYFTQVHVYVKSKFSKEIIGPTGKCPCHFNRFYIWYPSCQKYMTVRLSHRFCQQRVLCNFGSWHSHRKNLTLFPGALSQVLLQSAIFQMVTYIQCIQCTHIHMLRNRNTHTHTHRHHACELSQGYQDGTGHVGCWFSLPGKCWTESQLAQVMSMLLHECPF